MLKVFCAPARYTQGPHATAQLGAEIRNLGLDGPALIIAGRNAIRLLSETWTNTFADAGMRHEVFEFGGECTAAEIRLAGQAAREFGARLVIGAGGGKVLDTARAAAADLALPVVNCPTLASSDAPCSALSVIYTEAGAWEEYRIYRRNPDLVLVDTAVIAQSPVRPLVAGMGDALATWFEARVCVEGGAKNMRGGASTRSALALAELCYKTLLADGVAAVEALRQKNPTTRSSAWWKRTRYCRVSGSNRQDWPLPTPYTTASPPRSARTSSCMAKRWHSACSRNLCSSRSLRRL